MLVTVLVSISHHHQPSRCGSRGTVRRLLGSRSATGWAAAPLTPPHPKQAAGACQLRLQGSGAAGAGSSGGQVGRLAGSQRVLQRSGAAVALMAATGFSVAREQRVLRLYVYGILACCGGGGGRDGQRLRPGAAQVRDPSSEGGCAPAPSHGHGSAPPPCSVYPAAWQCAFVHCVDTLQSSGAVVFWMSRLARPAEQLLVPGAVSTRHRTLACRLAGKRCSWREGSQKRG